MRKWGRSGDTNLGLLTGQKFRERQQQGEAGDNMASGRVLCLKPWGHMGQQSPLLAPLTELMRPA